MVLYILAVFCVTMAAAGYVVELLFAGLGLIPANRDITVLLQGPSWNYTTALNLVFLVVAAVLVWRFLRTGGPEMLKMMGASPQEQAHMATDPVCGMSVNPQTAKERVEHEGTTYYCSADCRAAFEQEPRRYIGHAHTHAAGGAHV